VLVRYVEQVLWIHAGRVPFANHHGLGVAVN